MLRAGEIPSLRVGHSLLFSFRSKAYFVFHFIRHQIKCASTQLATKSYSNTRLSGWEEEEGNNLHIIMDRDVG